MHVFHNNYIILKNKKMSRLKRKRTFYNEALTRQAGLRSIGDPLDFGNGLTSEVFDKAIADFRQLLETYNTMLSKLDELYNELNEAEVRLRDLNERMLAGVASKYGRTSNEYEMAGGTRRQDRKRPAPGFQTGPKRTAPDDAA
jgi:hypothetical protein